MDSSNAEKAWDQAYPKGEGDPLGLRNLPSPWAAFVAGRASRDAEVAELTSRLRWDVAAARVEAFTTESDTFRARGEALVKQISELRAALGDSEARRAELEAVRDRVLMMAVEDDARSWDAHQELIRQVLAASPSSVVLEDRDREVEARALEDFAARAERMFAGTDGTDKERAWIGGVKAVALRLRQHAAAIRKGDTHV